jgi:hypothetical protein
MADLRPCRDRSSPLCSGFIEPGRALNATRCLNCGSQTSTNAKRWMHGYHRKDSALMRFLDSEESGTLVGARHPVVGSTPSSRRRGAA